MIEAWALAYHVSHDVVIRAAVFAFAKELDFKERRDYLLAAEVEIISPLINEILDGIKV